MSWEPEEGPVEYRRAFCSLGSLSGGPAGSYGSGTGGSTANVYAPQGQGTADTQAQSLLTSLYDLSPSVNSLTSSYANNPYYSSAQSGAGAASSYGQGAAADAYGYAPSLYTSGTGLQDASKQVLGTAFDPQQGYYQRGLQQTSDSANAINSMYGLGSSPYGAGLANDALRNYNLDWGDRQLKRQTEGLRSASLGDVSAGQLGTSAYNLGSGASSLESTATGLPSQAYIANLGDTYTGIKDQGTYTTNAYSDLSNYLGLGQSASKVSGELGSEGAKQQSTAASGYGALFKDVTGGTTGNLLFGSDGLTGALGLDKSTGLFGGGSGGVLGSLFGSGAADATTGAAAGTAGLGSYADLLALGLA